jgi:hypothetical protein
VLYHKPSKKYHHIERDGKVKTLSPDEIRRIKGMYSIPFNTRTEEIIWYLFNEVSPDTGTTVKEIYENLKNPGKYSNVSGMVSQIWKRLSYPGLAILYREKLEDKYYRYFPRKSYYKADLGKLMEVFHAMPKKQEKDLTVTATKETKQADTQEKQFEAIPEQTSMIPERIHVTFDINMRFGFLKE